MTIKSGRVVSLALVILGLTMAAASSATEVPAPEVGSSGGMIQIAGASVHRSPAALRATAASIPSCRHHVFRGNAGYIAVQTSPKGYVAWGIYMYKPANRWGHWEVDVFVGNRRVDHKSQNYEPHGSVSPKDAKPGRTFHIRAVMTNADGTFVNVPNACRIP
jgi:hypothetical protein